MALPSIESRIAAEIGARPAQVIAAVALLDEGATVPFIARYRKEITGALDDTQLRNLEERLGYLRELEERRVAVLGSINWGSVNMGSIAFVQAPRPTNVLGKLKFVSEDTVLLGDPYIFTKDNVAQFDF